MKLSSFKEPSFSSPSESRKVKAMPLRGFWAFSRFQALNEIILGFLWLAGE